MRSPSAMISVSAETNSRLARRRPAQQDRLVAGDRRTGYCLTLAQVAERLGKTV